MNLLSIVWDVSPVIFNIGSLSIRWYGVLFAFAFVVAYLLLKKMFEKENVPVYFLDKMTIYMFVGLLAGLRLGHCLFYEFSYYMANPVEMLLPIKITEDGWRFIGYQGLASHGGAIGLLVATFFFCRNTKLPYLWVIDRLVIIIGFAGAAVRIGNLMNSEIYGVATSLPWGFIFVQDGQTMPMHPTQIYEALSYIALGSFLYLYFMKKKTPPRQGFIFGIFLIVLFVARFLIEFIKISQEAWEDSMTLNMGQWLSVPFIVAGIIILFLSTRYQLGGKLNLSKLVQKEEKKKEMKKLILVRHGESEWNKANLFTGWTDVGLSKKGVQEAYEAGKALKEGGFAPEICFTSYLKRAIKTLNNILDAMDMDYLPVEKSWRLNEKHYGALQGLNKKETVDKYGEEQVLLWRRGFDVKSPILEENDERAPSFDPRYKGIDKKELPLTESLQDCIDRLMPYFQNNILKAFETHDEIIVVAHGNSLRGIVKTLKGMSDEEIIAFNIPTGIPYVFHLNDKLELVKDEFIGDAETIKKLMEAVANQGKK